MRCAARRSTRYLAHLSARRPARREARRSVPRPVCRAEERNFLPDP